MLNFSMTISECNNSDGSIMNFTLTFRCYNPPLSDEEMPEDLCLRS